MHAIPKSKGWIRPPAIYVAVYLLVLLLLFLFGMIESRVDSEGMGFLPLFALTTPWSWLLMGTWDFAIWGRGSHGGYMAIFVTCNIISGLTNSYLFYLLTSWRKKRKSGAPPSPGLSG